MKQPVQALRDKVSELGAETVAAFLCEPVQGSGGVIVPPQGWLRAMCEACRDLDILFIADEVITGFEPFVEPNTLAKTILARSNRRNLNLGTPEHE